MTTTEPDLLDALAEQQAVIETVATDHTPSAREDADRIRAAILADGRGHGGVISRNRVRAALTNPGGELDVQHFRIGAQYNALLTLGLIRKAEDRNDVEVYTATRRGRNGNKEARRLYLTEAGWTA